MESSSSSAQYSYRLMQIPYFNRNMSTITAMRISHFTYFLHEVNKVSKNWCLSGPPPGVFHKTLTALGTWCGTGELLRPYVSAITIV